MSKKTLFSLEYPVRCSPAILYNFLSTAAGLQEWFAEKVDEQDGIFTFGWNGTEDEARVLDYEENVFIRYQWLYSTKDEYFEFRINKSDITNQTILIISDFADKKEIKDQSQLWEFQVKELLHRIGS